VGTDTLADKGLSLAFVPSGGFSFDVFVSGREPVPFTEAIVEVKTRYFGFGPTDLANKGPRTNFEIMVAAQAGFVASGPFQKTVRYFYSDLEGQHYSYSYRNGHIELPALPNSYTTLLQPGQHFSISLPDSIFTENCPPPPACDDSLTAVVTIKRGNQGDSYFKMTRLLEKVRGTTRN
jgi:hypothetical protein